VAEPRQIITDFVRTPLRTGDEVLQILRRFVPQIIRQLPAVFAIDLRDQPLNLARRPLPNLRPAKPRSVLLAHPLQLITPTPNVLFRHIPSHLAALPGKMYNIQRFQGREL